MSERVSFQSSFSTKKTENLFLSSERDKFKTSVLKTKSLQDMDDLDILFFDERVKASKKLERELFTNFLNNKTDRDVIAKIVHIFNDPFYLKNSSIDGISMTEKLHSCINEYVPINYEEAYIFKANVKGSLGDKSPLRVYLYLEVTPTAKQEELNKRLGIILLDPFHLAIPSRHKEGKKHYTKEEMEKITYNRNKNNVKCMTALIEF
ncbi:hypothetical protein ACE106_15450 [Shouchella clausii]|uniref:hypothetical protein n=1 Tax=Shouchella clausii TaxID=79880 RepID=UPI00289E0A03|nr:hypothetical protein [Shouchella clausii]